MTKPTPSRRAFLKGSLFGALLLEAGARWPVRRARAAAPAWLTVEDRDLVHAVAGAMLRGTLPVAGPERSRALDLTLAGVERSIRHQPAHVRDELRELFNLLQMAPVRLLMCGFWSPWSEAEEDDIDAFLSSWRESRIELLRLSYLSLQELITSSFFSEPMAWARIGYEGPPEIARPDRAPA